MTFSCPVDQVKRAEKAMRRARRAARSTSTLVADTDVCQGLDRGHRHAQPCRRRAKMFQTLRDEGINIKVITTSEIKVSVLIDRKYMELAVQALHDAFGLERASCAATSHAAAAKVEAVQRRWLRRVHRAA
jgi:aspartate kinase